MTTPEIGTDDKPRHWHEEANPAEGGRLNWLRAAVLGANDGIVSTAGVVMGVAGATTDHTAILVAGVAALTAGALSMAAGEYVSVSAQRDSEKAMLALEAEELEKMPETEQRELARMWREKGLSRETAERVAAELTEHDALRAHAEIEFGIDPDELTNPWHAAWASMVAFTVGGLIPLLMVAFVGESARVVVTVAVYGFGIGRLAERLGLASTSPQGVLFVGDQGWVVDAARVLEDAGIRSVVVSSQYRSLAGARMSGLTTVNANILSDYAVKDMELAGIGSLIACTPDSELNATAAREFAHVLGRAHVFQLRRRSDAATGDRRRAAGHLSARYAFRPALSEPEMGSRVGAGMTVKKTPLTDEFTLDDFLGRYGEDTVLMFAIKGSELEVLAQGNRPPQRGVSVVALVHEHDHDRAPAERA